MPPPPLPDTQESRRFRLWPVSIILLIVTCVFHVWLVGKYPPPRVNSWFSYACGEVIGILLIVGFVAWLLRLICRRSNTVGNVVFILGICGLSASMWMSKRNYQNAINNLDQTRAEMAENIRKSSSDDNAPTVTVDQLKKFSSALGNAGEQMSGPAKRAAAAQQRLLTMVGEKMQSYSDAYQALMKAGSVRAATLPTKDDIAKRREVVKAFAVANDNMAAFYKNVGDSMRKELEKEKLSASDVNDLTDAFLKGCKVESVLQIRATDSELATQLNKVLDIYEREWGLWEVDKEGKVSFKNDSAVDEYNAALASIKEIGERQRSIQKAATSQHAGGQ